MSYEDDVVGSPLDDDINNGCAIVLSQGKINIYSSCQGSSEVSLESLFELLNNRFRLPPKITLQPESQEVNIGEEVTFIIEAVRATSYQWRRDGVAISGATSTSYTIAETIEADDGAEFDCVATGPGGVIASNSAILTVSVDWTPTDASGGWWLDSQSGITKSGDNVTAWASSGTLAPAFLARSGSAITTDQDGVYFRGVNEDFLYESSPVAKTDDHTVFVVFRPQAALNTNQVIVGRYRTTDNNRSWQVAADSLAGRVVTAHSSDGQAATAITNNVAPIQQLSHRYYFAVVRKSGTSVKTYWRGELISDTTTAGSTVFDAPIPTTIGARGGTASSDGAIPFQGWIKHVGFYNRALSDEEVTQLMEWGRREEHFLVRGDAFGADASAYGALTKSSYTIVAPNGATPAEATPLTHRYRHHVAVGRRGSRTWCSYSSGAANEDASGQQLHVSYSDDDGATWTGPIVAVGSIPGGALAFGGVAYENGAHVCFSRGFYEVNDKLYVTIAVDRCGTGDSTFLKGVALLARECNDDGTLGTLVRIDDSGDGYTGAPAYDATLAADLYPLADQFGVWGGDGPDAATPNAAWVGWETLRGEPETDLTEATTIRLSSQNWVRLLRCTAVNGNGSHVQTLRWWVSRTYDAGATWTSPTPTDLPNTPSAGYLVRLADRRIALLANAQNISGQVREKLSLMLFEPNGKAIAAYVVRDGLGTTPVYAGTFKSGGPAYPGAVQVGGDLHIGYSVWKERVDFTVAEIPA
jgi:hypothetical protein